MYAQCTSIYVILVLYFYMNSTDMWLSNTSLLLYIYTIEWRSLDEESISLRKINENSKECYKIAFPGKLF